jgi:FG-GAP-like repeat
MKSARFVCPFVFFAITTVLAQSNPVPLVNQPLVPTATAPGGQSFTFTVNGTGFVSGSTVNWNGTPLTTTFVSSSQLTATVPASDIATASTASVTVSSPSPGGGNSNVLFFAVSAPTSLQFTSVPVTPPQACVSTNIGPTCSNLVAADFNRDGKLDLAGIVVEAEGAALFGPAFTSLGSGDGTFQAPVSSSKFPGYSFFVTADFNGDGKLDLVGATDSPNGMGYEADISLGNGDGTFSKEWQINSIVSGSIATQVVAADFNGDGKLDVAIAAGDGIEVYLGNGDGTFQSVLLSSGGFVLAETVGDFNGDGKLDIVGLVGTQLEVFLGNGDGTFQIPTTGYTVGAKTSEIFAADLNGDNKLDLIALQSDYSHPANNTMTVLLGNGDGTFQPGTIYPVGGDIGAGVVADVNADGKLDVVLADSTSTVLSTAILLGNGDGTFRSPLIVPVPADLGIAAGDFNNDGKLDLAISAFYSRNGVLLLLQDYAPDFSLAAGSKTSVTVASGQTANYTVNVVPGAGFAQTVSLTCSGAPAQSMCMVSPSSVALDGIHPATATVAVTSTASAMGLMQPVNASPISGTIRTCIPLSGILGLIALATLGAKCRARRPQMVYGAAFVCLLSIGLTMSACGGGSSGNGGGGGTQAGTYNLTVTGSFTSGSNKLTHNMNLTLVVQ